MIRGAIFDFDGTLFDSMSIWETAGADYVRSAGREPKPGLRAALKPLSFYQSACYIKEEYGLDLSPEEVLEGFMRVVEDFYLYRVQPKPGVREWLEAMRDRGIRMIVATASAKYQVEAALERCGMRGFFEGILTCDEAGAGKDSPLVFRKAMELLGTDRQSTVVIEDAWHAAQTAKADGFTVAAVYDAFEPHQEELRETADVFIPDCRDLEAFWKLTDR